MFFDGWHGVARTVLIGALTYGALLAILQIAGKRTLSTMDAFDLVVTVALGSTLANTMLSKDIALAEGLAALLTLALLQYALARLTQREGFLHRWVRAEPTLLFRRGEFLRRAMRSQRVAEDDVRSAIREQGISDLADVEAVVLETNGNFSVVRRDPGSGTAALAGVQGAAESGREARG